MNLYSLGAKRLAAPALLATLLLGIMTASMSIHAQERPNATMPRPSMPAPRPPIPVPRMVVPEARLPIQLAHVQVDVEVTGLAARTRIEMEFRNPNERPLEGELQFPLRPGQTVTGFALDINGELRLAVPVEKAKGRQVFEDVTRTRVDPALLEATAGNNYKLRVYPLPPLGTRRVVLDISETLARGTESGGGKQGAAPRPAVLDYQLPLQFEQAVGKLDATLRFPGADPRTLRATLGGERIAVQRGADGVPQVTLTRLAYAGSRQLRVTVPAGPSQDFVSTGVFKDTTYFYAELPVALRSQPRAAPGTLAIVWDASGSGAMRDHGREFALLDAYFKSLGQAEVQLSVVRDVSEPVARFAVTAGDWRALRQHLEKLTYDGATNMGAMAVPAGANLALLFTDGLGNYGTQPLPPSAVPLYALTASSGTNAVLLRGAAEATGGQLLDLLTVAAPDAVRELRTARTRLVALRSSDATELVSAGAFPEAGRIMLAGKLASPSAAVEVDVQAPDGVMSTRRFNISSVTEDAKPSTKPAGKSAANQPKLTRLDAAVAPQRWAALTLAALEADTARNRAAIRRLGKAFSIPTGETSLIVLDAVGDYARYEIEPPDSLRPAYERLIAQKASGTANERQAHLKRVVDRFKARQDWWDQEFPKDEKPKPRPPKVTFGSGPGSPAPTGAAPPAPTMAAPAPMMPPPAPPPAPVTAGAPRPAAPGAAAPAAPTTASIQLRKWEPDAPYARRMRDAKAEDLYAIYLDERPSYTASTAFFLDAADILISRGQTDLGLRVLSNLAEMNLENRHILRILAYRLTQAKQVKLALPVLRKVLELSPDEPQSHRDLALALSEDGQDQAAINMLYSVVTRPWAGRFPDIEMVALTELNAIAARSAAAGKPLDTSAIDPRLLRNLPLDVRAVLSWDADNTDIDLWVTDPNNEQADYSHQLTYQGGRMSNDFTGGYGPEEFSLRTAKPGKYTVQAQFYGHNQQIVAPATTLMLRLSTGFGTPAQKDETVVLRLSGKKEVVTVGDFTISPAPAPQAWSLRIHHPFRPGVLVQCENRFMTFGRDALAIRVRDAQGNPINPLDAPVLTEALQIRWNGGTLSQPGVVPAAIAKPGEAKPGEEAAAAAATRAMNQLLSDSCFTLFHGDKPVVAGAIVPDISARLLEFPVLAVKRTAPGEPLSMTLLPRYPADVRDPVPAEWRVLATPAKAPGG